MSSEVVEPQLYKFKVPMKATMWGVVYVVAKDEDEAMDKAYEGADDIYLCHNCSGTKYDRYSAELSEWEQDGKVEKGGEADNEDDYEWKE